MFILLTHVCSIYLREFLLRFVDVYTDSVFTYNTVYVSNKDPNTIIQTRVGTVINK